MSSPGEGRGEGQPLLNGQSGTPPPLKTIGSSHPTGGVPVVGQYEEQPHSPLPPNPGRFGNPYLRFTLLFTVLIIAIAFMPLWVAGATPKYCAYVNGAITILFGLEWLVIALNAVRNYRKLNYAPTPLWRHTKDMRLRHFKHVVIVPCYLDPLEILHKCIESLAKQRKTENLVVVVTFEKKTPELQHKIDSFYAAFKGIFGDFLIVVHELRPATEIPGGCSNKNYALREAYKYCSQHHSHWNDPTYRYTLTTCDTDSLFHPFYFETLELAYNAENPTLFKEKPNYCVWQPPLFYNWDLAERPFFNRVTCLMRTMMMLGGLISFNLNPMSIFSYPLELGHAAGFINPRYSVDDIIAKVRWMCDTNSQVPVRILPVPVISGPTIGTSFTEEVTEWGRQIRRWIVGSSESFHYFVIHFRCRPFFAAMSWFCIFFSYYGVLLCCAGISNVLASIPYPWAEYSDIQVGVDYSSNQPIYFNLKYCGLVSLTLQMVAFGIGFIIDAFATNSILQAPEKINPIRNFIHWLSSPFVLLAYSLIAFISIVRFAFEGKKMAGHDMAAKEGFTTKAEHTPAQVIRSKRSLQEHESRRSLSESFAAGVGVTIPIAIESDESLGDE